MFYWHIYASLSLNELILSDTYTSINKTIIDSENGLLHVQRQAITWPNDNSLSIGPAGTHLSEIWIKVQQFSLKKFWENVCKMAAILSQPQYVNSWLFDPLFIWCLDMVQVQVICQSMRSVSLWVINPSVIVPLSHSYTVWNEITHPFPNFNDATVGSLVMDIVSNLILHFTGMWLLTHAGIKVNSLAPGRFQRNFSNFPANFIDWWLKYLL